MILWVHSGLMSRCRAISDAYYLVKKYESHPRLIIIWPQEWYCNIRYEDAFDKSQFNDIILTIVNVDISKSISIKRLLLHGKVISAAKELKNRYLVNKYKHMQRTMKYIDFNPPSDIGWIGSEYVAYSVNCWKECESFLQEDEEEIYIKDYAGIMWPRDSQKGKETVKYIRFIDCCQRRAQLILDGQQGKRLIGVHIRRGDHEVATKGSPTEAFIQRMQNEIAMYPDVVFFLATDDAEVEQMLRKRFGEKIISMNEKDWRRDNTKGIQDGITDAICLSMCSLILGSYSSQFSGFAAEYGDIPLEIVTKQQ